MISLIPSIDLLSVSFISALICIAAFLLLSVSFISAMICIAAVLLLTFDLIHSDMSDQPIDGNDLS